MLPNDRMNALFRRPCEATEEAIVNALVAAETMTGRDGRRVEALPHDRLRKSSRSTAAENADRYLQPLQTR